MNEEGTFNALKKTPIHQIRKIIMDRKYGMSSSELTRHGWSWDEAGDALRELDRKIKNQLTQKE